MESCRFCCVSDPASGLDWVCFSRRTHGRFSLSATDAADVWTKDFSDEEIETITHKLSLDSADDFCQKLRRCELQEDGARLSLVSGSNTVVLDLTKMAAADAAQEVKRLLFKMADSLSHGADNGAAATRSPTKIPQRRAPDFDDLAVDIEEEADFEPRQQNSAPSVTARKRLPGSSLINPGAKKKRAATGVAFDDPDDD